MTGGRERSWTLLWVIFLLLHTPYHTGGWFQALKCTIEINTFKLMDLVINLINISAHLWVITWLGDISPEWREAGDCDSRFCPEILKEKMNLFWIYGWIYGSEELVHVEITKSLRSGGSLGRVRCPQAGRDRAGAVSGLELSVSSLKVWD